MSLCAKCRTLSCALLFIAATLPAIAQTSTDSSTPNEKPSLTLGILAKQAGLIFSGTVISIENNATENSASMRITFQVDDGIRGAKTGKKISILEWSGLWNASAVQHYHVGESLLVFYHAPDATGFTSTVGGSVGRFSLISNGLVRLSPTQKQTLRHSARLREIVPELASPNDLKTLISYGKLSRAVRLLLLQSE